MCEPTTWAAIALTAAGSYSQYRGSQIASNAMNNARLAEADRQNKLRAQSDALFQKSLKRSDVPAQDELLGNAMLARQTATTGAQKAAPVANVPVQGGTPKVVADETATRVSQGNTDAARTAALRAALSSYGDLSLNNSIANATALRDQSTIGNFMQGSQGVLGTELEAASHKGDKMKNVGAGLQAVGQLVGMYGAMQPKPPVTSMTNQIYANILTPDEMAKFGGYFPKL